MNHDHDYNLDLDLEAEIAGMSQFGKGRQKPAPKRSEGGTAKQKTGAAEKPKPEPEADAPQASDDATTQGLGHDHGREAPDGGAPVEPPAETENRREVHYDDILQADWKQFRTLSDMFIHVGGNRPVQLKKDVKRSQVSGLPEPLISNIQAKLKSRHEGAEIEFPWGTYTVTDKNKVFTVKSTLVRYLTFDGMRDSEGTHVQYAKQWLALNHPAFDESFRMDTHLKPTDDALDIYALLHIAHMSDLDSGRYVGGSASGASLDDEAREQLTMMNMSVGRVLDKLTQQESALRTANERSQIIQTILVLDRMGLLRGGIPKDIDQFAGVLEANRDALHATDGIIDKHTEAEKARLEGIARRDRLSKYSKQK